MALNVISHTPEIYATGVYRNQTLSMIFNKSIQPLTVTWETISVHDGTSYATVVGSLGTEWSSGTADGTVVQATFTPESNLLPNTKYVVYVFGTPQSIIATDGEEIPSTYSWEFTTGLETYDEDTASGTIPSGTIPSSVT